MCPVGGGTLHKRPSLGSQVCKGSGARVLGWEGQERKPKDKEERSQTVSSAENRQCSFLSPEMIQGEGKEETGG